MAPTIGNGKIRLSDENGGYSLVRVKRAWVPDWLWHVFCFGNLATFTPFREILTRRATAADPPQHSSSS